MNKICEVRDPGTAGRHAPAGNTHPNIVRYTTIKPAPNSVLDVGSNVSYRKTGGAYRERCGSPVETSQPQAEKHRPSRAGETSMPPKVGKNVLKGAA